MTLGQGQVMLLPVSQFAKICDVTARTIRFYEQTGLVIPHSINPFNNYRYYEPSQALLVQRIKLLQEFGLSLDDIKQLNDDLTHELLSKHINEIQTEITERRKQLKYLKKMQSEYFVPDNFNPAYENMDTLHVLAKHYGNASYTDIEPAIIALEKIATAAGIEYSDSLTIFDSLEYSPLTTSFDIGLIVADGYTVAPAGYRLTTLPTTAVMSIVHTGPMHSLELSYQKLQSHIQNKNLTVTGRAYEIYLKHKDNTKSKYDFKTKICLPVQTELNKTTH